MSPLFQTEKPLLTGVSFQFCQAEPPQVTGLLGTCGQAGAAKCPSDPKLLVGGGQSMKTPTLSQKLEFRAYLYLHLVFVLSEFLLGQVFHGTPSCSLLNPPWTRSESMGAALCWTPWLKEEAALRLVEKSTTILRGDCSSNGSIWADTAASLFILSLDIPLTPPQSFTQESSFSDLSLPSGPTAGGCGRSQVGLSSRCCYLTQQCPM